MINFTSNKDRAKQIEHAIDSEENEKKKKKQILTKNIEVKKLKSTRHNLPGSGILQSQKSGDTQSDGYEMRSKIVSEEMRSKKTVKGSVTIRSQGLMGYSLKNQGICNRRDMKVTKFCPEK
uniref:Uncharacterized protein n=1 Tax=Oryza nivara TaxID=4536 RepID=A0A0E0HVJ4_ORYNI